MVQSFLNHIPLGLFVELVNVFPKIILSYLVPCIIFLWIESGKVKVTLFVNLPYAKFYNTKF